MYRIAIVACFALFGAILFQLLNVPIPWLLGPIVAVMFAQFRFEHLMKWPTVLRNAGLVILGVAIGQQFDISIMNNAGKILIAIVFVNAVLLIFSVLLAYLTSKWTGLTMKTSITSSVPGGLSQLVLFAEEEKDIPLAVVTYFHVIRVISVVLLVPFIVSGHVVKEVPIGEGVSLGLLILIVVAASMIYIGKLIRIPVPHFLTPMLFTLILQFTPITTPTMPSELLHIAQLLIGAYIGLLLKRHMLKLPAKTLVAGVCSAILLLVITGVTSIVVAKWLQFSFATGFLSTAPGGLDQMGLLAAAVGADISVVTLFQLVRLLLIFLVVLPLLKWMYRRREI